MAKKRSMLEYIQACTELAKRKLTVKEFTRIRNFGTEEELIEAIERMAAQGGYDNLDLE